MNRFLLCKLCVNYLESSVKFCPQSIQLSVVASSTTIYRAMINPERFILVRCVIKVWSSIGLLIRCTGSLTQSDLVRIPSSFSLIVCFKQFFKHQKQLIQLKRRTLCLQHKIIIICWCLLTVKDLLFNIWDRVTPIYLPQLVLVLSKYWLKNRSLSLSSAFSSIVEHSHEPPPRVLSKLFGVCFGSEISLPLFVIPKRVTAATNTADNNSTVWHSTANDVQT